MPVKGPPKTPEPSDLQRLDALHQLSPNPLVAVDAAGKVTFANNAARRTLEPLGPKASAGAFFPSDMDSILAQLRRGEPAALRRDVVVGNRIFEENIQVSPDHDAVFIHATDITELRRYEQELRRQSAFLTALVESPTDVHVFALDHNCCYTAFNAAHRQEMKKLYGTDIQSGTNLLDVITRPEVRSRMQQTVVQALAGESFTTVEFDSDLDTWHEFNWSPVRAADGDVEGVTAFVRDITRRKRVETALTDSELKYRGLFESSNDALMLLDTERLFDCNEATLRVFGCSIRDEFLGKHPADVSPPRQADGRDSRVAANEEIAAALQSGRNYFEWLHQRTDGTVFPADVLLTPVDFRGQRVLQATVRDISDRKQAEQALRDSEERYRRLVADMGEGIGVGDTDERFTFANRAAEELFGVPAGGLVGRSLFDFLEPKEAELVKQQTAQRRTGRRGSYELEITRSDRTRRAAQITASPQYDTHGNYTGSFAIFRDITDRKQGELRDKQHLANTALLRDTALGFIQLAADADVYEYVADRLSRLVGEAYVIINSHDEATDEFTVRAIAGIGTRLETMLKVMGRNPVGTVFTLPPEHRPEYASEKLLKFDDGIRGLSYGKLPKVLTRTIEKTFDIGGVYAMGFHWQGRILGTLNLIMRRDAEIRDPGAVEAFVNQAAIAIQHRRDAEELAGHRGHLEELVRERTAELEAANWELEAFSYSVSHDLRTPLRAIDGFAQALVEDCGTQLDAKARADLARICSAAERMAHLIDDLLDLARIARLPLERKKVDLSELARSITAELRRTAPDRNVEFVIPDGLTATADPVLAEMVLRNLLGNAWKFTSEHPTARIEFGTTRGSGEPAFFIRDDGVGFDMTYSDKLFVPFERLHSGHEFPGSGIGLAIVQRIIRRHGGRVWFEAQVNGGATCWFTLEAVSKEVERGRAT